MHEKTTSFEGEGTELPKKGAWIVADLRGCLAKKKKRRGDVFEVCVCVCVCVELSWRSLLIDKNIQSK